jgi:hypothetical protein
MESKYKSLSEWNRADPKAYNVAIKSEIIDEICEIFGWERIKRNYWNKERCREQALNFDMKERWKKGHPPSYHASRRNNWVDELTNHMVEGCKPRNYWTYELCKNEALKYEVKEHWKKQSPQSYQAAGRNGWYHELTTHMIEVTKPNGYWTKEKCIEHAKQFSTVSEWLKANSTPCTNARLNGWYDECTAHMFRIQVPNNYWKNKERCIEEALKYKTKGDWAKNNSASYTSAHKNGWFEECTAHMLTLKIKQSYWTLELCKEEALKYDRKVEWQKKSISSYRAAKTNGWYDECCTHMVKKVKQSIWTLELCKEEALKFDSITNWKKNNFSSYNVAKTNNWVSECCIHMVKKVKQSYWTLELCKQEALKFDSRIDWYKGSGASYSYAQRNKLLDECCTHMVKKVKQSIWTLELCKEEALKFDRKVEWVNGSGASYQAAKTNGWYKECITHMKPRSIWTLELCKQEALKYDRKVDWKKCSSASYSYAQRNCWLDECCTHMINGIKK